MGPLQKKKKKKKKKKKNYIFKIQTMNIFVGHYQICKYE